MNEAKLGRVFRSVSTENVNPQDNENSEESSVLVSLKSLGGLLREIDERTNNISCTICGPSPCAGDNEKSPETIKSLLRDVLFMAESVKDKLGRIAHDLGG